MKCNKIEEILEDYLDEELTEEDKKTVDLHLQNCRMCSQKKEAYKSILVTPFVNAEKFTPSPQVWWNVRREILKQRSVGYKYYLEKFLEILFCKKMYLAVSALVILLAVGSVYFYQKKQHENINFILSENAYFIAQLAEEEIELNGAFQDYINFDTVIENCYLS